MNYRYGVAFLVSMFFPVGVYGATLYVDPPFQEAYKGDTFTASVRLLVDEGECINAVDSVITYEEGVQAVDVSVGRSILSLWVERPKINTEERTITFAGGVPNGYCGRIPGDPNMTNVIADIVFRAPAFSIGKSGSSSRAIGFTNETHVYLNDGLGTMAQLSTLPGEIQMIEQVRDTTQDTWTPVVSGDKTPPQPFSIELVQNEDVYSGRYYIVFNTTDKQSGIDRYEVMEESRDDMYAFRWGRADAPWKAVESPYVLEDQTLGSIIRVRAVDKAGNERISVFIPNDDLRKLSVLEKIALTALGTVFLVVIALITIFIMRRRRKILETSYDS